MPSDRRHLLDIAGLSVDDIRQLLDRARRFKHDLRQDTVRKSLTGKVVLTLFAENSTRTRLSFEMAALRLGASLIDWDENTSSAKKGESFDDTIRYIAGYRPDAIIVRHSDYNAPYYVSKHVACPVINAGDSWREHPSQALLDAMTILEHKPTLDGLKVAIVGDIAHSRVANSNIELLTRMGAQVHLIAPVSLLPQKILNSSITLFEKLDDGITGCDVVMTLRLQKERMDQAAIPDEAAYFRDYGLTTERLALSKADAIVMHPGPMNRGVEIADDVADDPRSVIFQQGANGVPMRMAILESLMS